jgi:replicative DNA helicase|tara:strand:+ start:114 stop:1490 length:1377 start_codon:yes stop_codon:yes gene_type:complete
MNKTKKISEYGYLFQVKFIVCLITDKLFLEQIVDILDGKYIGNDAFRWIINEIREYYNEYKDTITMEVFKIKIQEIDSDLLAVNVKDVLREVFKNMEASDLNYVKDKALDFHKSQVLKDAIVKSAEILERDGDSDEIKSLIDIAMQAGVERNLGHDYLEDINKRYEESARITSPTPWDLINELMQGGLGAGELGVIVAPAGIGKTWVLCSMGAYAISQKLNIIHYTLELNEAYVGLRYDSIFSGVEGQNLKYHKDEVIERLDKLEGNLTIKYYPTKSCTVNTLSAHLKKVTTFGTKVDMVLVDYADIMKDINKHTEMRHALGNIYEDLRGLAGELQVPIWTASQTNRSALDEDVIEASRIAESYAKVMVADFVMSLSRKIEDKIGNTGRFHVIKNRFGPDGLTYPARINTNIGKIELFEATSIQGKDVQYKINNRDNQAKQILSQRYDDLMKGEEIDN